MPASESSTERKTPRCRTSLPGASQLSGLRTARPYQSPAEHRQTFPDSGASHHTAVASWTRKPDAWTSDVGILPHSSYVETTDEAEHRWSTQNSNIRRMEYDSDSRETGQGSPRPRASILFAG